MNFILGPSPDSEIASKVLMGLPFYGYHYMSDSRAEAILGPQYVELLKNNKPKIVWNEKNGDHETAFQGQFISYPSLQFLQQRLQLAETFGVGVSIWELGQGLDYFYDLL